MLKEALAYANHYGFSVIPVGKNKKPLVKWQEYQTKSADTGQIKEWWAKNPDSNIGIITGSISNLAVIDIDEAHGYAEINKVIPANLKYPIVKTPSGGHHYYFRMPSKELRLNVRTIPGCDLRAEGGYVVAPPSVNQNGKYFWEIPLKSAPLVQLPNSYVDLVLSSSCRQTVATSRQCRQMSSTMFQQGKRDNDLFHVAHCLNKGGMPPEEILEVLEILGNHCNFPPEELVIKVKSAIERSERKERNLTEEIREYVLSSSGVILSSDVVKCLHLSSREDMKHCSKVLNRLTTENVLEKHGGRNGSFRVVDTVLDPIDWNQADDEEYRLEMPLGIGKYVKIMPKNLIVVAGSPNAGKTAFLLDIVFKNMHCNKINYFSSEMSNAELKGRLRAFGEPLSKWKFEAFDRCSNFADVIRPDEINIIDFLEIHDEFWKVGALLKELYEKLNKGICIIALQKKRGADTGKGGDVTREKPRLYLTMEGGKLCIEKAKNWRHEGINPNNMQIDYKLVNGSRFLEASPWAYKDGRPIEPVNPY